MIYIIKHRLKFEREKKGWSQKYLSEKTGIPSSNISRTKARNATGIYTLRKLADLLECTADYLLGRTDNPLNSSPSGLEEIKDLLYRQNILKHKNTILGMDDIEDIITFVEIIVRKKHDCINTRYIARAD